jgi:uncharacterized protein HemX
MKEQFEKFVASRRHEFDDKNTPDGVWGRIASALFRERSTSLWNSVSTWRIAAVILLGLSVYLFFEKQNPEGDKSSSIAQQDFTDVESYYAAQILEKVALISNEGLFADESFTQDLQKLEAMYTVLAEEMKKHPSEKVKDALVLNMLVRIDLLNQQIQKLEDSKRKPVESTI